jgi:hypothetical protein
VIAREASGLDENYLPNVAVITERPMNNFDRPETLDDIVTSEEREAIDRE